MRYVIAFFAIFIFAAAAHAERVEFLSYPGLQMALEYNSSNKEEKNIIGDSLDELPDSLIWIYCFLDITPFIDSFLGNLRIIDLSSPVVDFNRKKDITHPGFYLKPPSRGLKSELTQTETTVMNKFLNESLGDTLRPFGVADFAFIYKYENVMSDTARTEFFGKADIGGVKISVGGWFGKFASIGVFADFNDIDSFLELANVYFNLPPLNRNEAVSHKKDDEYFFSLKDKDNMFLIRGYDTIGECWRILNEPSSRSNRHKVIELIKYYDEEFMP